jgi:uncharacterized protein
MVGGTLDFRRSASQYFNSRASFTNIPDQLMTAARIRRAPLWLSAVAILVLGSLPSQAQPSFDCRQARVPVERLICASPELSGLDEMLARSYTVAVGALGMAGGCLRSDQSRWLRAVRNACQDDACLRRAYQLRLGELNPFQPGATFVKDASAGPALVAVVPPGTEIRPADSPDNPDPKPMTAEGRLAEEGGGYVLTARNGAQFIVQNFYFSEVTLKRFTDILVAADDRTRFRISGYRAAVSGQSIFEPRRCILIHRLLD